MSDSLGDGAGRPTEEQIELYRRWSAGGAAVSVIGEVQVDHRYPEKPGNLVLGPSADGALLARLAHVGSANRSHIWPQLGHAGALAHPPISRPAGPSALNIEGLYCDALTRSDVDALPAVYASAAAQARAAGSSGVEVHAGHGFLLSQFLSPLFNRRSDRYGGPIEARCQLLLDIVRQVRVEVGSQFAIAVKVNSSDQPASRRGHRMVHDATDGSCQRHRGEFRPNARGCNRRVRIPRRRAHRNLGTDLRDPSATTPRLSAHPAAEEFAKTRPRHPPSA